MKKNILFTVLTPLFLKLHRTYSTIYYQTWNLFLQVYIKGSKTLIFVKRKITMCEISANLMAYYVDFLQFKSLFM